MRLSESFTHLINNGAKFLSEAEEEEAQYISALRSAVLKKAAMENFKPDLDWLEAVMFEAYDRDMPLEEAKEQVWLSVYVDKDAGPEVIE
jgi:hypothetical protein